MKTAFRLSAALAVAFSIGCGGKIQPNIGGSARTPEPAELEQLRAEMNKLRADNDRLRERAEAMALLGQPSRPTTKPELNKPDPSWTPEQLLQAYFSVRWWQERIPMVLDPEKAVQQMAEAYKGWQEDHLRNAYVKIHPLTGALPSDDTPFAVLVDYNDEVDCPFFVVRTPRGFRIDWLATMAESERQAREKLLREFALKNASIAVTVLRKTETAGGGTKLHISLKNDSDALLRYASISCVLYDAGGRYLGTNSIVEELRPRAEKIVESLFLDTDASKVDHWKFDLQDAAARTSQGKELRDAHHYIHLVEK